MQRFYAMVVKGATTMRQIPTTREQESLTQEQAARFAAMFGGIAKEAVTAAKIKSAYYVFGSELACLRIFAKYQANGAVHNPKARVGYSPTHKTWYFSLES